MSSIDDHDQQIRTFGLWVQKRWSDDPRPDADKIAIAAMGITGEAGEVSEKFKKWFVSGKSIDRRELTLELGDTLHYWAYLCYRAGIDPIEVMRQNMAKLNDRYPGGHPPIVERGALIKW